MVLLETHILIFILAYRFFINTEEFGVLIPFDKRRTRGTAHEHGDETEIFRHTRDTRDLRVATNTADYYPA